MTGLMGSGLQIRDMSVTRRRKSGSERPTMSTNEGRLKKDEEEEKQRSLQVEKGCGGFASMIRSKVRRCSKERKVTVDGPNEAMLSSVGEGCQGEKEEEEGEEKKKRRKRKKRRGGS